MNEIKLKWYTHTEWVDIETGEIIAIKERHKYIKLRKTIKYTINNEKNFGERTIQYECARGKQLTLW